MGTLRAADGEGAVGTSHTTCTVSVELQQVQCSGCHSFALHAYDLPGT